MPEAAPDRFTEATLVFVNPPREQSSAGCCPLSTYPPLKTNCDLSHAPGMDCDEMSNFDDGRSLVARLQRACIARAC
jgi:hypothetical protein